VERSCGCWGLRIGERCEERGEREVCEWEGGEEYSRSGPKATTKNKNHHNDI
jgi:hypothetical protein